MNMFTECLSLASDPAPTSSKLLSRKKIMTEMGIMRYKAFANE